MSIWDTAMQLKSFRKQVRLSLVPSPVLVVDANRGLGTRLDLQSMFAKVCNLATTMCVSCAGGGGGWCLKLIESS